MAENAGDLLACSWVASRRRISVGVIVHGFMGDRLGQSLDTYSIIAIRLQPQDGTKLQTHHCIDSDINSFRRSRSHRHGYMPLVISPALCRFADNAVGTNDKT